MLDTYNISDLNSLNIDSFLRCHDFIDNIESHTKSLINSFDSDNNYISTKALVHPTAIIGENVYIDDDVKIGPYCFIKSNSILLKGVNVGFSVELDRVLLFENVKISHNSCIGRSIIGRNSNLAFNFVVATKSLIEPQIKSYFNGQVFTSSRRHHGAVIGENFVTGVNVSVMPGTTVEQNVKVRNSKTISLYIKANSMIF